MPIVFEEVTGEVLPEREREQAPDAPDGSGPAAGEVEARVREVLFLERRRAERLSDR